MTQESITALIGLAISMTWTPGPNNTLLSASGANFGWRKTLPHVMGVTIGFPLMLSVVALGLERAVGQSAALMGALRWIGIGVILMFAWRIAMADPAATGARGRPLTFLEAVAFQWVNPKAWGLAVYVTTTYGSGHAALSNTAFAAAAFLVSGFASSATWAVFGAAIGVALSQGWRLRAFNIAMALLLLASAGWLFLES